MTYKWKPWVSPPIRFDQSWEKRNEVLTPFLKKSDLKHTLFLTMMVQGPDIVPFGANPLLAHTKFILH